MPLNLASPGILVREVDLTTGRVDPTSDAVGAIVGPFSQGPVNEPILVQNEQELLDHFGDPNPIDNHYEHWMVASSYLSYGGPLQVVRSDDTDLKNARSGGAAIKVKSYTDYLNNGYDENIITSTTALARSPGSWANGIKISIVDAKTDQILTTSSTSGLVVGMGITESMHGKVLIGTGSTSLADGHLKGIITEVGTSTYGVKVLSHTTEAGVETAVDYEPSGVYAFKSNGVCGFTTAGTTGNIIATKTTTARSDWYDAQTITLSNSTIKWNTLADRPQTSSYANARGSRFDEVHVVVIDDTGDITGNAGTILEKHLSLSKAKDAEYSAGSPSYWRKFIGENSGYIFAGAGPTGLTTSAYTTNFELSADNGWDQDASGIYFGSNGSTTLTLANGLNYNGQTGLSTAGALQATIGDLSTGYDLFSNEIYEVDFLLQGSGAYTMEDTQALASKLISVAEARQDAVAFISPNRGSQITETNAGQYSIKSSTDCTNNLIQFYASVPSSSYAVFDSGYKYMYDRFSDTFRYVPLNGDIAGTCARNDSTNFPWFSPAGTTRGAILNAVKLAFNPSKIERDTLYSNRINPIIFSPGAGIVLFGDKTGLAKASAFDRINVRRLFIYLEDAIKAAAKDVMFEFNDSLTRNSFVNAVEPFLRDVQAKRGIQDFRLICDDSNNTASIIDANEFIADIFIKPSRSINFIGLTFVATKSGVSFSEVIGNV